MQLLTIPRRYEQLNLILYVYWGRAPLSGILATGTKQRGASPVTCPQVAGAKRLQSALSVLTDP
jgi:hypothetical protein